jgi:hypothetical protein
MAHRLSSCLAAPVPPPILIQPSAWKGCSANFAYYGVLGETSLDTGSQITGVCRSSGGISVG